VVLACHCGGGTLQSCVLAQLLFSPSVVFSASAITVHTGNAFGWSLGALLCARMLPEAHSQSSANFSPIYRRLPLWISLAYLCKHLIEAMEGRIWIESSGIAGEGSRVCVMLPAAHRI